MAKFCNNRTGVVEIDGVIARVNQRLNENDATTAIINTIHPPVRNKLPYRKWGYEYLVDDDFRIYADDDDFWKCIVKKCIKWMY